MDYTEALNFFHSAPRFKGELTQKRMVRLCELLGSPQKQLKFVHVAGTNGKGSTCSMIASVLSFAGYKTGLFVSPFVVDFRERMQINGAMIARERLAKVAERVREAAKTLADEELSATEFELVTAAGLLYFYEERCDIVVLEVGLGGRFDATNVIEAPLVAVITKIAYDHMAQLGNTLSGIAYEKCGIIKGGAVVSYPEQYAEALRVIEAECAKRGARLYLPELPEVLNRSLKEQTLSFKGIPEVRLPLGGLHQSRNCAVALKVLSLLGERGFAITGDSITGGLYEVKVPARLEVLGEEERVIVDGAHNPDGIAVLLEALSGELFTAIFAAMADKEFGEAAKALGGRARRVIACELNMTRAAKKEELTAAFRGHGCEALGADNFNEALEMAYNGLLPDEKIVVCGSFFLASEARALLSGQPPKGDSKH